MRVTQPGANQSPAAVTTAYCAPRVNARLDRQKGAREGSSARETSDHYVQDGFGGEINRTHVSLRKPLQASLTKMTTV